MRFQNGKAKLWTNFEVQRLSKIRRFLYHFTHLAPKFLLHWIYDSYIPLVIISSIYMWAFHSEENIWFVYKDIYECISTF